MFERSWRHTRIVGLLFAVLFLLFTAPASAAPVGPMPDLSLEALRLGDLTARGRVAYLNIYFPGHGDYQLAEGSYLQLELDHSPLLRPQDSTLTAVLNGVPVGSLLLTPDNARRTTWRVELPAGLLATDINHVQLRYFMRLQDDDCTNHENPALYSTVYAGSFLHYQYSSPLRYVAPAAPDLGRFPDPFLRSALSTAEVAFVVPDQPSTAELSAAATIAARLGQAAGSKPLTTQLYLAGETTPQLRAGRDLVVIGTPDSNPLLEELAPQLPLKPTDDGGSPGFLDPSGQPVAPESGVLQEIRSPWDERYTVLVVSGGSEEGLRRAARVLGSRLGAETLRGRWAVISEASDQLGQGSAPSGEQSAAIALGKLGVKETTFQGYGSYSTSFSFDALPPDGPQQAYLDLVMSHSPALDSSRSSVAVALNGTPTGTLPLKADHGSRFRWRVPLPGQAIRPGANSITVTFNLYLPRAEGCGPEAPERAWATLHQDSALQPAPSTGRPSLDMSNLPYPFVQQGTPSGSFLVLPDDPVLLKDGLQVAVALGRHSSGGSTELQAGTASSLTEEVRGAFELIAYGLPENNEVIAAVAARLPLALRPGSERTLQNARSVLLGVKDAANLGFLELVPSPWNAERALLVVSGTSPEMARHSYKALRDRLPTGNVAIVSNDEKGEVKVTTLTLPVEAVPSAGATQVKDKLYTLASLPPLLVIVGMLGLMLNRLAKP